MVDRLIQVAPAWIVELKTFAQTALRRFSEVGCLKTLEDWVVEDGWVQLMTADSVRCLPRNSRGAGMPQNDANPRGAGVPQNDVDVRGAGVPQNDANPRGAGVPQNDANPRGAGVPQNDADPRGAGVPQVDPVPECRFVGLHSLYSGQ